MSDRIEKSIELNASPSRVWRALSDYREFGSWFGVALKTPFVIGEESAGAITHPGMEHHRMTVRVIAIEPERRFAFEWHPFALDPAVDYTAEPPTLVEFTLAPAGAGTRMTVVESGFDRLSPERRAAAFPANERGWAVQLTNIATHVGG